jgi:hypothetical protein
VTKALTGLESSVMNTLRRLGKIAGWTALGVFYVWFAAVRNADRVRAKKAARRLERQARLSPKEL